MVRYVAYNKLYFKGRSIGRRYKITSGSSRATTKRKAVSINAAWNRLRANSSKGYRAKLVAVKRR